MIYIETKANPTEDELLSLCNGVKPVIKSILLNSKEEAEEYLTDIFKGDPIFVRYLSLVEDIEENKTIQEIKEKLIEEESELKTFPLNILNRLKEQTSQTKGCKSCGSSINKEYLIKNIEESEDLSVKDFSCPICKDQDYILNSSDEKRLSNILKRIENLKTKLSEKTRKSFEKAKKVEFGLLVH